jgi:hypothetical protein
MARVPEIIRRNPLSQVAPEATPAGQGWRALSQLAKIGADFIKPAAEDEARREGEKSVYRDEQGNLKVDERSLFSGEMGAIQNQAAFAKYLSKKQIDMNSTMSELAIKYEFDPGGFKEATDAYTKTLRDDPNVPDVLKEDIVRSVEEAAGQRFNGLHRQEVARTYREADKQTQTARDLLFDDYVSLSVEGDEEAAAAKWEEITALTEMRADAPYISETPAEAEAVLRGARGTAKAASLLRDLADLEGADEISDEQRAKIEEVIKDPDISPGTRQKLYTATQGRFKEIDAAGIVRGMTSDTYTSKVVRAESGGRDDAKAATSSAFGPHQFLKGTWAGLVKRYKPEWAQGLSSSQIQAMRGDRAKSTEMFDHFRRENQDVLRGAGMPIDDSTEYMAHFFGAGTAVKVLSADPDTPVSAIVSKGTIEANGFLRGMTARDARNWAARKMTVKASDLARMSVKVDMIEDPELRRLASNGLSDKIKVRRNIEAAEADVFEERLAAGDVSLTEQEIRENHNLSTDDQVSLTNALQKVNEEADGLRQIANRVSDPDAAFDPGSAADKKDIDTVYKATLGDTPVASPEGVQTAVRLAKTGIIPKSAADTVKAGVQSNDPSTLATALETANALKTAAGGSLSSISGAKKLDAALSDFQFYGQFMDGEQAAQRMIENREKKPKNVTDEAKDAAKKLDIGDVVSRFDQAFFSSPQVGDNRAGDAATPLLSGPQENEMMSEYTRLFKDAYMDTADFDLSQNRALDEMDRIYGVNEISGNGRIMKFPPQKVYPPVGGNHEWMNDQLVDEVNAAMFGDEVTRPNSWLADGLSLGGAYPNWVNRDQISLVSDATTASEVKAGRPASYLVYAVRDGELTQMPQRFEFNPGPAKAKARTDFEEARGAALDEDPQTQYYRNVERFGKDRADEMLREARGITAR